MKKNFNRWLFPKQMVLQQSSVKGLIPVASMQNACELLFDDQGDLSFCIKCKQDEKGYLVLHGTLEGQVSLGCAYCLERIRIDIVTTFLLACVESDEEAKKLPEKYEPLLMTDKKCDLYAVLEEELLLNLPMTVYHKEQNCQSEQLKHKQYTI